MSALRYSLIDGARIRAPRGGEQLRNDDERALWVDNDEGLYHWWRRSHLSKRAFVRANRDELDQHIGAALGRHPLERER